jgi:hypothetical protein
MSASLPIVGTELEIYGILGTFLTADLNAAGETVVTARVTERNLQLVVERAAAAGSTALRLSKTIVQVPTIACIPKHHGNSLSNEGYLQSSMSQSLTELQRALARRMRFSA